MKQQWRRNFSSNKGQLTSQGSFALHSCQNAVGYRTVLLAVPVYAASAKPDFGAKNVLVWGNGENEELFEPVYVNGKIYKVKVTSVKSSNPAVIEVKKGSSGFKYRGKKTGTSTVTIND